MTSTRIGVTRADQRAQVEVVVGALAPRIVDRGPASARVAIAAAGMLLLAGDHVQINVRVGDGCLLEIDDVGGTVVYPSRGVPASWKVDIRVGVGATLVWNGLPFIVAAEADVERDTTVALAERGAVLLRETLVLGRHGEIGGRMRSSLRAVNPDGELLVERMSVDGGHFEPGVWGQHRVMDSVVALGWRPPVSPGDLVLDGPGAVVRHFGSHSHGSPIDAVWGRHRRCVPLSADGPH